MQPNATGKACMLLFDRPQGSCTASPACPAQCHMGGLPLAVLLPFPARVRVTLGLPQLQPGIQSGALPLREFTQHPRLLCWACKVPSQALRGAPHAKNQPKACLRAQLVHPLQQRLEHAAVTCKGSYPSWYPSGVIPVTALQPCSSSPGCPPRGRGRPSRSRSSGGRCWPTSRRCSRSCPRPQGTPLRSWPR